MTTRHLKETMIRQLALLSILAFSVCAWTSLASTAEPGTPGSQPIGGGRIKVLLVGGRGHDWKGFHAAIAPVLEKTGDFQLTLTSNLDDLKSENISKYNVVLFYGSGGDFSDPKQEEGLHEFVKNGGGLAGVHATDAFKKSDVYWRLFGGRFTTHGGGKFWLRIEDKQHAITTGMEDFEIQDETYQNQYHPDFKLHSLGRIDRGNEQQSMVWVQDYGQGRVFNTTLGHDGAAWSNPHFQRLLVRGLYWAAGREPKGSSLTAGERNVALASEGSFVSVDSLSVFGRNDGTYGGFDFECKPEQLNDGRYVTDPALRLPHGNRWISQVDRKHPHWAWIGFAGPRRISRVVVRCSSVENYPTDFRGQYSPDNGVTVKDLFVVRDQKPDAKTMAMEFKFDPVLADNFRLFIDRSTTTTHSNFTQLSEIEVYGEGDEIRPQAKSAPGLRDVKPLLISGPDDQVQIEERADEIEIRSPWQKLIFARGQPQITYLSCDSEGQGKLDINFLGPKEADGIQPRVTPAYSPVKPLPAANLKRDGNVVRYGPFEVADGLWMNWEVKVGAKDVEMATMKEATRPLAVRPGLVHFDMDAGQTPIGPFYRPGKLGLVGMPCLLHAPDCGSVLVESAPGSMAGFAERAAECQARGKTWWSYFDLADDFPTRPDGLVEIKRGVRQGRMRWSVQRVIPVPSLTAKEPRLAGLSRYALNGMQFRPDTDLLGNSITSINCGFCMFEYAEVAQWLPILPGGIDPCDLLRRSLDTYFAGTWAHDGGPNNMLDPNSGYNTTVDTKPALIYAAWTFVRKTGDLGQLRRWLPYLERLGTLMEETADGDGLLQTVKSTRGGGWYDVLREEGKSAYGNALAYRAFQYLADLETLAGQEEKSKHFAKLADRLRAAFYPTLFNPETGVVAGWKTKDGKLHDYWFPYANGMAIIYGLVPEKEANRILDRFQAKFKEVGFNRFDLGLPNCLINIPPPDYAVDNKFQQYLNGGAAPCFAYWYIQAMYQTGRRAEADAMLWPLIKSYGEGLFNGGVAGRRADPVRGEWHDWSGKKCGGEGFLPDCYHAFNSLYNGYYGITFEPEGYRIAPWSLLKGGRTPLGLQYMGKPVDYAK